MRVHHDGRDDHAGRVSSRADRGRRRLGAPARDLRAAALLGDPAAVLALQRAAGNRATAALVAQRYTVIDPGRYRTGAGAEFPSQEMVEAGGTADYRLTTKKRRHGGGYQERSQGVAAGTWGPAGAAVASAKPRLKYATDGATKAMALEDTAAEPKVFYATDAVKAASNAKLAQASATVRVEEAGGTIDGPRDVRRRHGPKLTLKLLKPASTTPDAVHPGRFTVLDKFGAVSECNSFVKFVIGDAAQRVAVFGPGAGSEAAVDEEHEPTQEIADFAAHQPAQGPAALAAHLAPTRSGTHEAPLPAAYTGMAGKTARDQQLRINAGARARVGEGYVITANTPMPDDLAYERYLAALDNKAAGLPPTADELQAFKGKWGYHYAGVVARVGDNTVTLENYNRGTVMDWQLDKLYNDVLVQFAQFRAWLRQTLDDERAAGQPGTIPSVEKTRRQWFKLRATAWRKHVADAGRAFDAINQQIDTALQQVDRAQNAGLAIANENLFSFKMYGSRVGQSFHEQWAGALEDPMTLRIRQSLPAMKTVQAEALDTALATLVTVALPTTLATAAADVVRTAKAQIPGAATPAAVDLIVQPAMQALGDARRRGIRAWARQAAVVAGQPPTAIPAGADATTIAGLIDGWAAGGRAILPAGRTRLAERRAELQRLAGLVRAADALVL